MQKQTLGPEREVAHRGAPGPGDDGREARLDAEARRCVPRAAGGGDGDGAGAAREGEGRGQPEVEQGAEGQRPSRRAARRHHDRAGQPEVVYVPTYDPAVVYGPWRYPATRRTTTTRPLLPGRGVLVRRRVVVGRGDLGRLQLGRRRRPHQPPQLQQLQPQQHLDDSNWRHNVDHRKGVAYRDQATARSSTATSAATPSRASSSAVAPSGTAATQRGDLGRGAGADGREPGSGWRTARRTGGRSRGSRRHFARLQRRQHSGFEGVGNRRHDARLQQPRQRQPREHGRLVGEASRGRRAAAAARGGGGRR